MRLIRGWMALAMLAAAQWSAGTSVKPVEGVVPVRSAMVMADWDRHLL